MIIWTDLEKARDALLASEQLVEYAATKDEKYAEMLFNSCDIGLICDYWLGVLDYIVASRDQEPFENLAQNWDSVFSPLFPEQHTQHSDIFLRIRLPREEEYEDNARPMIRRISLMPLPAFLQNHWGAAKRSWMQIIEDTSKTVGVKISKSGRFKFDKVLDPETYEHEQIEFQVTS